MLEIATPTQYSDEITKLYQQGLTPGDSTGWQSLDEYYTIAPHYWTIITGIPSDGKSTWLDNLMLNLMRQGWKFVLYSPENQPVGLHLAQLVEKAVKRPFRAGYHNRLSPEDLVKLLDYLENGLRIIRMSQDSAAFPDLLAVLDAADDVIRQEWQHDKVGVIIDPWNELDHSPICGMNETQMTNFELMQFRYWIRQRNTHGFIVAHPQKPQRARDGTLRAVNLYDINGSAAYFNKSDHGIVVRRNEDGTTEISVEKCRFKHLGKKGSVVLRFNPGTGTYDDDLAREQRYRRYDQDGDSF